MLSDSNYLSCLANQILTRNISVRVLFHLITFRESPLQVVKLSNLYSPLFQRKGWPVANNNNNKYYILPATFSNTSLVKSELFHIYLQPKKWYIECIPTPPDSVNESFYFSCRQVKTKTKKALKSKKSYLKAMLCVPNLRSIQGYRARKTSLKESDTKHKTRSTVVISNEHQKSLSIF